MTTWPEPNWFNQTGSSKTKLLLSFKCNFHVTFLTFPCCSNFWVNFLVFQCQTNFPVLFRSGSEWQHSTQPIPCLLVTENIRFRQQQQTCSVRHIASRCWVLFFFSNIFCCNFWAHTHSPKSRMNRSLSACSLTNTNWSRMMGVIFVHPQESMDGRFAPDYSTVFGIW